MLGLSQLSPTVDLVKFIRRCAGSPLIRHKRLSHRVFRISEPPAEPPFEAWTDSTSEPLPPWLWNPTKSIAVTPYNDVESTAIHPTTLTYTTTTKDKQINAPIPIS
jgi:hypothetical protein